MTKILLALIAVSIIGIVAFFYLTNQTVLSEKTFTLDNQKYSMLVPGRFAKESKTEPTVVSFKGGGKKIAVVIVNRIPEPKYPYSHDCANLRKAVIFTVNLAQLDKRVDVCEDPLGLFASNPAELKGFKILGTSGFKAKSGDSKNTLVQVTINENYLITEEGKTKVKQIFESFKVLN